MISFLIMPSLKDPKLVLFLLILISLTSFDNNIPQTSSSGANQTSTAWTVMVYLDGDNDLESAAIEDFNELELVANNEHINFVVLFDRCLGEDYSNGDWTTTRFFEVSYDADIDTITSNYTEWGEKNMGNPQTLADFIDYSQTNYPADNYALILWDHGTGVIYYNARKQGGVCWDDYSSNDYLTFPEIESVLKTRQVNFLAFDTCLTAMVEVVHQLGGYVDVMVFSEETMPIDGSEYQKVFMQIDNTTTAIDLGIQYVEAYEDSYGPSAWPTLSAVDTSYLDGLMIAVNNLAQSLIAVSSSKHIEINDSRTNSQILDSSNDGTNNLADDYIDLYDFCYQLSLTINDSIIISKALNVMSLLNDSIIAEFHHTICHPAAYGLSIYFPWYVGHYDNDYEGLSWSNATQWDELLNYYFFPPEKDPSNVRISDNEDITYNEGTLNHQIVWDTFVANSNCSHYEIYQNGSMIKNSTWDGGQVIYSIEGLTIGVYNITVIVYDTANNWAADTVFVKVKDLTPPTITQPSDLSYVEGTTGHQIIWNVSDLHPSTYKILQNDIMVDNATWEGESIIYKADGLTIGIYNITIIIYDLYGHNTTDIVIIRVTAPVLSSKEENGDNLPAFMFITILIMLSGFVSWQKKRNNKN